MILFSFYIDLLGQLSDAERNVYYANVFQKAEDEEQKAVYCLEDYTIQSLIAAGRSWQRAKDTMRLSELALYELDQELFKRYELIPLACESYSNLYACLLYTSKFLYSGRIRRRKSLPCGGAD